MNQRPRSVTETLEQTVAHLKDAHEGALFCRRELRQVASIARRVVRGRMLHIDDQERVALALLSALARLDGSR